ncbi:MAG: phosphatidylserine decarboxylase family protein [Prolixibacteraceae bacterium]
MRIHREGAAFIALVFAFNLLALYFLQVDYGIIRISLTVVALMLLTIVLYFFRIPRRELVTYDNGILAPCDGKVVVLEEVYPEEYFVDKRIQVSIFMSVLDVHINRNPINGMVVYSKYYKGKHLVAWHRKSSTANERHSVVYRHKNGKEILTKQIAGAVARRIVNYLKIGKQAKQGREMGFIKFGSRIDMLLPMDAKIKVKLDDVVRAGITIVAEWE